MPLVNQYGAMSEFARSQVVRDRVYGGIVAWAAGQSTQPAPSNPDDNWIKLRMLAERVPQAPDMVAQKAAPYLLQVSDIVDHLALHLSPYLEVSDYDSVRQWIDNALQIVMPQIAAVDITTAMVAQWRVDKGYVATNGSTTTSTSTTTAAPTTTATTTAAPTSSTSTTPGPPTTSTTPAPTTSV